MARIFISYATPDRATADEVASWLRAAGHEPFLDHDLRDGISVGEDWEQRLYRELREVDAVIGVVTSSFVASNWCSAELGVAGALGCRLMPLRAEAGVIHPLMPRLQYADYHDDPGQARDRVLQAVRLLQDGGGTWRPGDNPFPGLEPFTAALSRVFFGRAAEAREVGNRLRAMSSTGGMLAVVGPSGSGKSSLLNAAVAPLLGSDPAWLTVPPVVPGGDPLSELARALANTANRLGLSWSASDIRSRLEAGTDGLRRVADELLAAGLGTHQRRLLVAIDQAEELFTRTTPAALQRFAQLLRDAVAGPVQVVSAMRSEFLDDLRDLPALAGMPIEAYVLAPLDREMLRDVIEQPAKVARLHLDNGLAAQLVADTDSGEALPLLAFTLRQLADGLPLGGTLTLARYRDLGGVRGALTRHADTALTEAVRASGLTEREVLAGLTRLVTIDETGRRARRRIKLTSLTEPLRVALQVFIDRRLLLSDTDDDGQVWFTVAHEALLTGWRPLDTATADITVALRTARTVEQAAAEWNSADRPEHYRQLGPPLTGHNGFVVGVEFAPDGRTLATASMDGTVRLWDVSDRDRPRPVGQPLTGHSRFVNGVVFSPDGLTLATASGDQAVRLWDVSDRDRPRQLGQPLTGHIGGVNGVVFAPDGRTLATVSVDQTVRLWDVSDRDRPHQLSQPLTGHIDAVVGLVFAPDGRTLATASSDRTAILWDLSERSQPRRLGQPLTGHTDFVNGMVFSPDGLTLATASSDRTVRLWDVSDRDRPTLGQLLRGHIGSIVKLAVARDGRTLATASEDKTAILWDLADRNQPRQLGQPLTGHPTEVLGVAFAPDGQVLATAGHDLRLWDLADRNQPRQLGRPLAGNTGPVTKVAFAPDGRTLAAGGFDLAAGGIGHTVKLWDLPRLNSFPGGEVREACIRAGGPLDRATWDQYALGVSYQDTCAGR